MSDEREMLAEVVRAAVIDWNTIGTEKAAAESDVSRYITDAILASPQFARLIAAAKGEALREAAHEVRHSVMPHHPNAGYRDGHEHSAWVVESLADAALTAEPVVTEGEGA